MLLNKYDDLAIDPARPWAGDIFERETHGARLSALVQGLTKPYVISVRAGWGTGKSVFLRRLAGQLERDGVGTVIVDAWKTDYLEDPLLAFVSEVQRRLEEHAKRSKSEQAKQKAKKLGGELAKHAGSLASPLVQAVSDVFVPGSGALASGVTSSAVEIGKRFVEWDRAKRTAEDGLREDLQNLRDILSKREQGRRITRPIAFIIDELDRCRPDYAVKALERIKHFFNVQGVVFILATDKANLPNAIRNVYGGSEENAERYLRKFIDFEYSLPTSAASIFTDALSQHFDMGDLMEGLPPDWPRRYEEAGHHEGYRHFYEANGRALDVAEAISFFAKVSEHHELSLRDQAQAFTILSAVLRTLPKDEPCFPQALAWLCGLRFAHPGAFEMYVERKLNFSAVVEGLQTLKIKSYPIGTHEGADLRAFGSLEGLANGATEHLRQMYNSPELFARAAYRRIWSRVGPEADAPIKSFGRAAVTLAKSFS